MEHFQHKMDMKNISPQSADEEHKIADTHIVGSNADHEEGVVTLRTDSSLHRDIEEPEDSHEGGEDHKETVKKVIGQDLI